MNVYDEVWAAEAGRITAFFGDNCEAVTIIPLPERRLGPMTIPQTRVIITGDDADELYHRFRLKFMTAGG